MTATYRECTFSKDDNVHVERFEVGLRVRVLVERSETDQVVVSEQLDLFSSLFQQNILGCKGMDTKDLIVTIELGQIHVSMTYL